MSTISPASHPVEIKTLNISGKKLTKSIFNQIEYKDCFDSDMNFKGIQSFGYVKEKAGRYLLWNLDGSLRKTNLSEYSKIEISDDRINSEKIEWFLKKCKIEYSAYDDHRGKYILELEQECLQQYNEKVKKVRSFLNEVLKDQIFI